MLNPKAQSHTIELRWKAQISEYNEDKPDRITYHKTKEPHQDLKTFIKEEKSKDATISLDFLIDGTDLGLWLNLHYFSRRVIGNDYANNISYTLNPPLFENINFYYQKVVLKRIIGQLVTLEDCMAITKFWEPKLDQKKLEEQGKFAMDDENQNTMLYCSGCCGDRLCGYFGIHVYHTNSHIIWHLNLGSIKQNIAFEKAGYFHAFEAYIHLINHELEYLGASLVSIEDPGEQITDINTQIGLLVKKYQINKNSFDLPQLKEMLKVVTIQEMNTVTYLAETLGFDMQKLAQEIDASYQALSEEEKNAISWKMMDNEELFRSLEFYHPNIVKKSFLLWG